MDGENLLVQEDVTYSLSSIRSGACFATTIISNAVKLVLLAKISEGILYQRFLCNCTYCTVILDQYSNSPSYRIGLLINEQLVTASDVNNDLYDNVEVFQTLQHLVSID